MSEQIPTREISFGDLMKHVTVTTKDGIISGYLMNINTDFEYNGKGLMMGGSAWVTIGRIKVPLDPDSTFVRN